MLNTRIVSTKTKQTKTAYQIKLLHDAVHFEPISQSTSPMVSNYIVTLQETRVRKDNDRTSVESQRTKIKTYKSKFEQAVVEFQPLSNKTSPGVSNTSVDLHGISNVPSLPHLNNKKPHKMELPQAAVSFKPLRDHLRASILDSSSILQLIREKN